MANTAFEAITTRQSWYASEVVEQYHAVEMGDGGKYKKADGTGMFAGMCEYGCEAADRMITVVKGTFPGIASGEVKAGDKLVVDTAKAGYVKTSTSGTIIGVALNDAADGELVSVSMLEAPNTVAAASGS